MILCCKTAGQVAESRVVSLKRPRRPLISNLPAELATWVVGVRTRRTVATPARCALE